MTVEEGFYRIQSNAGKNYYIIPTDQAQYYNSDASTPFLRTRQVTTDNSIWEVISAGDGNYYLRHYVDGKYVVLNATGATGNHQKAVHLESNPDLNQNTSKFRFEKPNTTYRILGPCVDEQDELIGALFGGSNMADQTGDVSLSVECGAGFFHALYGGCNRANITGNVTLNVWGGTFDNVFGGFKGVPVGDSEFPEGVAANITGNVTLNLCGGTITNAFGGSDQNGNISGQITVNVIDSENACPLDVTNVYGGGNLTPYSPSNSSLASPAVNVMHIAQSPGIRGDVYGGGLGSSAAVNSHLVVTIGYDASMSALIPDNYPEPKPAGFLRAFISGNVYGRGSLAPVNGSTSVLVQTDNTTVCSCLFGGGSQAGVTGPSLLQMVGGSVTTAVYGGCNTSGTISNGTSVLMSGGTTATVFGGGLGAGTVVDKGSAAFGATVTGNVFGGGNAGLVNGGTHVTIQP